MKLRSIICICLLYNITPGYTEETFAPRFKIDHKTYIDEALRYLLKERPKVKAENLEFSHMSYQYQIMESGMSVCGPDGCRIVPAAPFQETLSIAFTVLDSKRNVTKESGNFIEYDSLVVQFPTPRMPEWYILQGTSSSRAPDSKTK